MEKYITSINVNKDKYDSYFDKTIQDFVILNIKFYLLCICTLGIAYPWALCMKYKATKHHTVIGGKRLKFIGEPRELVAHWLCWWLLSVITFGIYAIVAHIRMEKWAVANTIFEDTPIIP